MECMVFDSLVAIFCKSPSMFFLLLFSFLIYMTDTSSPAATPNTPPAALGQGLPPVCEARPRCVQQRRHAPSGALYGQERLPSYTFFNNELINIFCGD